jgi:hypothetical protein
LCLLWQIHDHIPGDRKPHFGQEVRENSAPKEDEVPDMAMDFSFAFKRIGIEQNVALVEHFRDAYNWASTGILNRENLVSMDKPIEQAGKIELNFLVALPEARNEGVMNNLREEAMESVSRRFKC